MPRVVLGRRVYPLTVDIGREAPMTDEANKRADELHEAGMELSDAGDEDGAIQQYLKALALDPDRPSTLIGRRRSGICARPVARDGRMRGTITS
jgi:hypothetical protein